jgi:hypothetical protein
MIKRNETQQRINEWYKWAKAEKITNATATPHGLDFFAFFKKNAAICLSSGRRVTKWQWVHMWLKEARFVSD